MALARMNLFEDLTLNITTFNTSYAHEKKTHQKYMHKIFAEMRIKCFEKTSKKKSTQNIHEKKENF